MSRLRAKPEQALQADIRQLLSGGVQDPWKFAAEIGKLLRQHIECDLACLALVHNYPDPHLVIRDPAYRWLPVGTLGEDRVVRTLKIGGKELAPEERSMLGHVVAIRRAQMSGDVLAETFYIPTKNNIRSEVAVPVVLRGEVLGVLNCESKKRHAYDQSHLDLLRLVARHVASTLEELLTQRGMRTRFVEGFRQVGALLDSVAPGVSLEGSEVLGQVAAMIARSMQCRGCAIWLFASGRSRITVRGAVGKYHVGQSLDRSGDAARWLAIDGMRPVIDSQTDPPSLIVPLLSRGKPIGVIEVAEKGGGHLNGHITFTAADQALLQALQGQIAMSIELRRVEAGSREHVHSQSRRISGLLRISQTADLEEVLRETVKQVPKLCDGRYCSIFLWEDERRQFVLRASKGLRSELVNQAGYRRKEGLTGWVGHYGRSLNLVNRPKDKLATIGKDLKWESKYQEGGKSRFRLHSLPWLAAPILVAGRSVGVIRVSERRHPGYFSQADEQVLNLAAGHIGASIADLQEHKRRTELRARLRESRNIVTRVIGQSGLGVHGDFEESLREAVGLAAEGLRSYQTCLLRLNADGTGGEALWHPHNAAAPSPDPAIISAIRGEGFKCWNYTRKQLANDQSDWARFLASAGIVTLTGVVAKVGARPLAVLLLSFRKRERFDEEDRHIIQAYAEYLALFLEIARLAREFHESGARKMAENIARDIHDAVLHMLSAHVVSRLGGAKDMIRARQYKEAEAELTIAERAVRFAANECRCIMNILARHIVHEQGLVAALRDLRGVLALEKTELILELPPTDGPLPLPVKMHLYRIAEAALDNAIRYSKASRIVLRLEVARQSVTLAVEDTGIGFLYDDAVSTDGHYGLKGIRDRVRGMGGVLNVTSAPDYGASIKVTIPIEGEHANHEVHSAAAGEPEAD